VDVENRIAARHEQRRKFLQEMRRKGHRPPAGEGDLVLVNCGADLAEVLNDYREHYKWDETRLAAVTCVALVAQARRAGLGLQSAVNLFAEAWHSV
jgi:hypothetical protein